MSISITLHRSGTSRTQQVDTTTTGLDLFGSDRAVVAMRVDGNLVDLQRELHDGAEVEPVEATSEDGSTSSGTRLPTSWLRPSSSCTPR